MLELLVRVQFEKLNFRAHVFSCMMLQNLGLAVSPLKEFTYKDIRKFMFYFLMSAEMYFLSAEYSLFLLQVRPNIATK
jgi:hypothetical protein